MPAAPSPLARGPQWQLDDTVVTRIAGELAREMYTPEEVLERFGIDVEVFRTRIRHHPAFERAYLEAKTIWHGSSNARERVSVKAGMLFEDWLAEADQLFHDKNQPLSSKVELLKTMSKVAGFEQPEKGAAIAPGDRVVVNIDLSNAHLANTPNITIDKVAPIIDVTAAPEPLPEWNAPPVPEPAIYIPEPLPSPPKPANEVVPAQVTHDSGKKPKLVPYRPA